MDDNSTFQLGIWLLDWEAHGEKSKSEDQPELVFFVWEVLPGENETFQQ